MIIIFLKNKKNLFFLKEKQKTEDVNYIIYNGSWQNDLPQGDGEFFF